MKSTLKLSLALIALSLIQATDISAQQFITLDSISAGVSESGTIVALDTTVYEWAASGGGSVEILDYATDGYAQAVVSGPNTLRMFGLSTYNENNHYTSIDFAIYLHSSTRIYIMENGAQKKDTGINYANGDKIRVERQGLNIYYKLIETDINNNVTITPLDTSTVKSSSQLVADFAYKSQYAELDSLQVSDSFYNPITDPIVPGTDSDWTDITGVDFIGNKILKREDQNPATWSNGAASVKQLSPTTAGWIQSTVYETTTFRAFGLSESNDGEHVDNIDFAIYLSSVGQIAIRESGSQVYLNTRTYKTGDLLKVERTESGEIIYIHTYTDSGSPVVDTIYTSQTQSTSELIADVSFLTPGSTLMDVEMSTSFVDPNAPLVSQQTIEWTDTTGVTFVGDKVFKTASDGWGNAGAASVKRLNPTDTGWVEMTAYETNTTRTLGLSETNVDAQNSTIDFGIQLSNLGQISVIENGSVEYTHGSSYASGDVFRIQRIPQGVIKYFLNGSEIYESLVTSSTQLIVDVALKGANSTISNVQLSASFEYPIYAGGFWNKNGNTLYSLDNVAIGRDAIIDDYKLTVEGKILTKGVKVTATGWADFVFEDNYDLKSLEYVKQFIQQNNHLPNVPSEAEVMKEGVDLNTMDATLLRKIEELTLYLIKQNEQLSEQNKKIEQLEEELKKIKKNNE
jgi:hypothetical protein